LWWIYSFVSI